MKIRRHADTCAAISTAIHGDTGTEEQKYIRYFLLNIGQHMPPQNQHLQAAMVEPRYRHTYIQRMLIDGQFHR
jgi:hypothetical protein